MNTLDKSPISFLQEYAVMKHLPFPTYNIIQEGFNFHCFITFGGINTSAVAPNKKQAKHFCAERAVQILQSPHCEHVENVVENIKENNDAEDKGPSHNYVGKLNEICSQNEIPYPNYVQTMDGSKFVTQCKVLSHVTEGSGRTKKEGKQESARLMLEKMAIHGFENNNALYNTSIPKENEEEIIKLYQELSLSKSNTFNCQQKTLESVEVVSSHTDSSDLFNLKTSKMSELELKNNLESQGIDYTIKEFLQSPLILLLEMKFDDIPLTFMASENTYADSVLVLLKKAVNCIAIMGDKNQ